MFLKTPLEKTSLGGVKTSKSGTKRVHGQSVVQPKSDENKLKSTSDENKLITSNENKLNQK